MPTPIFIVDSSPVVRRMVEEISAPAGFEVLGFHDGPTALEAARRTSPAVIIADYHLDNMTFSGFCRELSKLEHLSDTRLISLINPADHPDEQHLRSLGVTAWLNKPFQADELLDLIQNARDGFHGTANGLRPKRPSWPPPSVSMYTEGKSDAANSIVNLTDRQGGYTVTEPAPPQPAEPSVRSAASQPQDAIKGFFDQLLQSAVKEVESRLVDTLPRIVEETVSHHMQSALRHEVHTRFNEMLSTGRMAAFLQPLVLQELPALVGKELAQNEPLINRAATDVIGVLIKEKLDHWVADHASGVIREQLTARLQAHPDIIQQAIQDEIRSSVAQQMASHVEQVITPLAREAIDRSVQHIVPDLAEQHIKAELKRLTDSL
ncbi:MAG: response regulator [Nitrospira sp.]|nr:response regulator [Nitrospira sp.]